MQQNAYLKKLLWPLLIMGLMACDNDDGFNEGPFFSKRTEILSFNFNDLPLPVEGRINRDSATITATVPFGTDRSDLVPTITISDKATVTPPSGIANNFSGPANYTVTAEDGTTQDWTVTVLEGEQEAQQILVMSDPIWNLTPSGTGVPSFFTTDGERGLAYGNGKLYITNNNDKILTLSAADGSQTGELNMTGIAGGEPRIADVAVSDDGSILACNTVEWTSDGEGAPTTFRVYRWTDENSEPTVFLSYTNTDYRMGDSFTVLGDVSGDAIIMTAFGRKFLSPATRGDIVFQWRVTNGVVDTEPTLINISGIPSLAKLGSRPHAQMLSLDSQELIINANDIDFTVNDLQGNFVRRIPNAGRQLYDGFTAYFEAFQFADKTVLATAFPRSSVESRLILVDMTNGLDAVTQDDIVRSESFMEGAGEVANINASGAVAVNVLNNNNVEVYCLITNQGIAKFTLTTELQ